MWNIKRPLISPGVKRKRKKIKNNLFFFSEAFKKNKSCSSILQNTLKQPNTELFMPVLKYKLYNPELIALGGEYISSHCKYFVNWNTNMFCTKKEKKTHPNFMLSMLLICLWVCQVCVMNIVLSLHVFSNKVGRLKFYPPWPTWEFQSCFYSCFLIKFTKGLIARCKLTMGRGKYIE